MSKGAFIRERKRTIDRERQELIDSLYGSETYRTAPQTPQDAPVDPGIAPGSSEAKDAPTGQPEARMLGPAELQEAIRLKLGAGWRCNYGNSWWPPDLESTSDYGDLVLEWRNYKEAMSQCETALGRYRERVAATGQLGASNGPPLSTPFERVKLVEGLFKSGFLDKDAAMELLNTGAEAGEPTAADTTCADCGAVARLNGEDLCVYCEQRQAVDILQRESSYCAVSLDDRIAAAQAERDAERAAELEPEPHVWPTDFEGP